MKVRGRRECADCGERWSYYETGTIACPDCGSVRSVATEDAAVLHTAGQSDLDLSAAQAAVDDRPIREVADLAADACRSFLVDRGFISAGELQPLDDVTVAAGELRAAAEQLSRSTAPDDAVERYFLALLRGAPDGDRPDEIPPDYRAARGLGAATVVDRYRADVARYLDKAPDPNARRVLGRLRDHLRRLEALDGDAPVDEAERLVESARELGAYLRGDEAALARVENQLGRL